MVVKVRWADQTHLKRGAHISAVLTQVWAILYIFRRSLSDLRTVHTFQAMEASICSIAFTPDQNIVLVREYLPCRLSLYRQETPSCSDTGQIRGAFF